VDLNKRIKECLNSTNIAVLATRNNESTWATPVYFCYDNKFNFYFLSAGETRHMKDIRDDPRVGIAIFTPPQFSGIYQIGLQVEGVAAEVPDEQIEEVYKMRKIRISGDNYFEPEKLEGHFVKEHGGVFIKVVPTNMHYIDSRYFGGNAKKIKIEELINK
jgi:uncharacterized protein YhbP (UPF0306 family)